MLVAALLAIASHCADPSVCPTREELRSVYQSKLDDELWAMMRAGDTEHPGNIVYMTPLRITSISDIYCDEPDRPKAGTQDSPSINCKATFYYRSRTSYMFMALTKTRKGWTLNEYRSVFRKR